MMTAGVLLIIKNIKLGDPDSWWMRIMTDIAAKSYGIYLAHIIVLNTVYELIDTEFSTAAVKIPVIAVAFFIGTTLLVKMLSYLPKGKWLIG
ncbi:hypothetical protein [Mucilaginibacter myungsuensis]|uniref:hypothetical protein n=1 Tax=Mucilaginibacter myungsuensis TaxID=649104 RepID=UPI001D160B47|nr:hypothetical protein [Mucilaginibacter myungsuensis]MDN3598535.1 hypothetical protein [Mucilaginibacter myungsuensis]